MRAEYVALAHVKRQKLAGDTVLREVLEKTINTSPAFYASTRPAPPAPSLQPAAPMQFSSIFDYRLLAVIWAQFHFTI